MLLLLIKIPALLLPLIILAICFIISGIFWLLIAEDLGRIWLVLCAILTYVAIGFYAAIGIVNGVIWLINNIVIT